MKKQSTKQKKAVDPKAEAIAKAVGFSNPESIKVITYNQDRIYFSFLGCPFQFTAVHKVNNTGNFYVIPDSVTINKLKAK